MLSYKKAPHRRYYHRRKYGRRLPRYRRPRRSSRMGKYLSGQGTYTFCRHSQKYCCLTQHRRAVLERRLYPRSLRSVLPCSLQAFRSCTEAPRMQKSAVCLSRVLTVSCLALLCEYNWNSATVLNVALFLNTSRLFLCAENKNCLSTRLPC